VPFISNVSIGQKQNKTFRNKTMKFHSVYYRCDNASSGTVVIADPLQEQSVTLGQVLNVRDSKIPDVLSLVDCM